MEKKFVLIIEDDDDLIILLKDKVEKLGFETICVQSGEESIEVLKTNKPTLIILDYNLPDMNGNELVTYLKSNNLYLPPFVVCTGMGDEQIAVEMMKLGAQDYIIKNKNFLDLIPIVIDGIINDIEKEIKFKKALNDLSISENKHKILFEELKDSEEKFSKAFQTSPHAVIITNPVNGEIVETNDAFFSMTGYIPEDIKTDFTSLNLWLNKSDRDNVIKQLKNKQKVINQEYKFKIKDGGIIIGSYSASIITIKETIYVLSIINDITELKEIENDLIESEKMLKEIQTIAKLGTYVWDLTTDKWTSSLILDKIFGIDEKYDRSFKGWLNIIHDEFKDIMLNYVDNDAMKNKYFNKEYKIIKQDTQNVLWVHGMGEIISDENDKPIKLIGTIIDITERKTFESELIIAKNKAVESDRLKSEFLSNMSHEIRTPMNSIVGFTDLLNIDLPQSRFNNYLNIIKTSSQLLLTIIEDVIDLSKIQSGLFNIDKDFFDIKYMMTISEEEYNKSIELQQKNITLVLDINKEDIEIYSDKTRIKQILNNLINNAIKFTDEGIITYGYTLSNDNIVFFVTDTGIGISKEHINKIYDRFYQIKDITKKKQVGTGLGLTICKSIVELLGGEIWVESELGVGSNFYFSIPIN